MQFLFGLAAPTIIYKYSWRNLLFRYFLYGGFWLFFLGCGSSSNPAKQFSIRLAGDQDEFQRYSSVGVSIESKEGIEIENVVYSIDGQTLEMEEDKIKLDIEKLGNKTLVANVDYPDGSVELNKDIKVLSDFAPQLYTYEIVNEFPHDMTAFTQGLEFEHDVLYEGTGKNGASSVRRTDFETGKILHKVDLDYNYFGEGITVLNDKIYQLTWQNKVGFIYDTKTLERKGSFQYGKSKEGWGLCNDGSRIYKSDGTEKIWILDPETLEELDYIEIVTDKSVFNKANELEYVDGKIYANVWQKESMMIINASTGAIEGVVNFGGLKQRVRQHSNLDVFNGIAYHPGRRTFFVTGKNWDKLFEVKLLKK